MLVWKIFVGVDLLILAGYSYAVWNGSERLHRLDLVTLPIGLIGSIGLLLYAFSLPTISEVFWRLFLPAFAASGAWEIAAAMENEPLETGTIVGGLGGLLLVGVTSIAIYRLGGSSWLL